MERQKSKRVLVADDDQSIRQLVSTIVRREDLEVDSAADGVEAIEKLKQNDYAVVLLDLMMPRLDGFGVIEYLRNNPPAYKPVILVVTAYADQKFKAVDPTIVAGVLRKPFEIADLGSLVQLCVLGWERRADSPATLDAPLSSPRSDDPLDRAEPRPEH
jgi:chemosensory pili system protein ChpA (sensor histidine kinase/response regulator)